MPNNLTLSIIGYPNKEEPADGGLFDFFAATGLAMTHILSVIARLALASRGNLL